MKYLCNVLLDPGQHDGCWRQRLVEHQCEHSSALGVCACHNPRPRDGVTNAFLTIETIVNYNCQLFPAPPSSQVLFQSVAVTDSDGNPVPLLWQPQIKHRECQQDVAVYDHGTQVALMYNSSLLADTR